MTKPKGPTPDDYRERDLAILRWIYLHLVAIPGCVSEAFFQGKACGHVLQRLAAKGWLESVPRGLPGQLSYYQLTKRGAAEIGVPFNPKTLSRSVRNSCIGVQCVCAFDGGVRITPPLVKEAFRGKPSNVPHVVTNGGGEYRLLRVFHAVGKLQTAKAQVERFFEEAPGKPHLAAGVAAGDFGLLVLAPTEQKAKSLEESFRKAGYFDRYGSLVVGVGPTDETLAAYLRKKGDGRA